MGRHCEKCGAEINDATEMCPECGANVRAIRAEKRAELLEFANHRWQTQDASLRTQLAAAREENEQTRRSWEMERETWISAIRARDEGRVERVAEELKRQFPVGVGPMKWWLARASAVITAADEVKP